MKRYVIPDGMYKTAAAEGIAAAAGIIRSSTTGYCRGYDLTVSSGFGQNTYCKIYI